MSADEFRAWLNDRHVDIARRAAAAKDSQSAIRDLERLYGNLDADERRLADPVIVSWATSDDPTMRFDGLALIAKFEITGALPALRRLADSLEGEVAPSAPYDWAKVNRIIGRLTSSQGEAHG